MFTMATICYLFDTIPPALKPFYFVSRHALAPRVRPHMLSNTSRQPGQTLAEEGVQTD